MSEAPTDLLVTGFLRSGTTLLDKLLHSHRSICLASQPFPSLYLYLKELFLKELGLERRYPLGHGFLEDGYEPEAFYAFLDRFELTPAHGEAFFDQMEELRSRLRELVGRKHSRSPAGT